MYTGNKCIKMSSYERNKEMSKHLFIMMWK